MDEFNKVSSSEEGSAHELSTSNSSHAQPEETSVSPSPTTEDTQNSKEKNFAALRQAKEKAERERDEMMAYIKNQKMAQDQALLDKQRAAQPLPPEEDIGIGNDDLVEGKHIRKIYKKMKDQEEQLKRYQQQSSTATVEAQLKYQYPDFNKVVSAANMEELRAEDPDLASSIASNPDTYKAAATAYKYIKKLGIYKEDVYKQDKERAQDNASKPRPLSSVSPQHGDSPLSHANAFSSGLTPDRVKQLRDANKAARENY